ncbi:hypothetical protein [Aquimarina macrocephali]|uniref:hypothetical protein n=1 Tax=Aquimarina macrocephali TaxID=666563 RepID=UPI003F665330
MDNDLHNKITATINSLSEYEIISSEDLIILLEKEGMSSIIALDISLFLPIVFCKKMLPDVKFPEYYIQVEKSGTRIKHRFEDNNLYNIIDAQTQTYFNNNPDSEVILRIASLSAEFQAINKLLLDGGNLNDVRLTETMIIK